MYAAERYPTSQAGVTNASVTSADNWFTVDLRGFSRSLREQWVDGFVRETRRRRESRKRMGGGKGTFYLLHSIVFRSLLLGYSEKSRAMRRVAARVFQRRREERERGEDRSLASCIPFQWFDRLFPDGNEIAVSSGSSRPRYFTYRSWNTGHARRSALRVIK